jgi:DNA-binding NarL/FixJ family response regulator
VLESLRAMVEAESDLEVVATASDGEAFLTAARLHELTDRERAVLAALAEGLPNTDLARRLGVSVNTVKFHLRNLFLKLGVRNRTEAAAWYLRSPGPSRTSSSG